jgi:hypothetical protein
MRSFAIFLAFVIILSIPGAFATSPHNVRCDGRLVEWSADEYLGEDAGKHAYFTWNSTSLFLAWNGTAWNGEGDLFMYINTTSGGSPYTMAWNGGAQQELPFAADYFLAVEEGFSVHLCRWSNGWNEI